MPQFSDDLRLGPVYLGSPDPLSGNPAPMDRGIGPVGRIYIYDVVPLTSNATNIAAVQAPAAAGNLVLAAGVGTTVRVGADQQSTAVVLDTARTVILAATTGAVPVTVYGFDIYGQPMSETFAAAGGGKKAFKVVTRATCGAAGTGVSLGTNSIMGFPVLLSNVGYLMYCSWAAGASSVSGVLTGDATPATSVTGDVRGTLNPASAPDGVKRLVAVFALSGIQVGPNATRLGAVGVPQA